MAERPVECSHCKKPIHTIYKEITEDSTVTSEMCADCPALERKLHGTGKAPGATQEWDEKGAGLACAGCGTNLEWIKMGNALGCSECYDVFADVLVSELLEEGKLPPRLKKPIQMKARVPLHLGKSPKEFAHIAPSEELTALSNALKDALKKENYEQAAWLRDQIKALKEKKENGDK